jgi:drug/metabolite transporter (DMT)-like permease
MPIRRYRVVAAALFTVVLWGSAFPGIRAGLAAYGPGELALLRYLFASATLGVIALARWAVGRPLRTPRRRDVPGIFALGALGFAVYHTALNYGQVTVSAGGASFLVETAPVFATLLAAGFLGERLSARGWAGVAVSLGGAALIAVGESQGGGGAEGPVLNLGALAVLLAAAAGAGYFTLQKPFLRRYSPLEITAYAMWAGTLLMGIWAPVLPGQVAAAPLSATLAVAYIGVLPGALAYVTYAYVLARLPVAQTTSLLYLVPLAAIPTAWAWHGEVPALTAVAGGVVTLAGVALVQSAGAAEEPKPRRDEPAEQRPRATAGDAHSS